MCKLRTLRRIVGVTLLALILIPTALGITAAEAGRRTHSFSR